MNKELWEQTIAMNDEYKRIEEQARVLADLHIIKRKQRDIYRRAIKDEGLAEIIRFKAWLAADPDTVNAYADINARDYIRFEMPEGWPPNTDPREHEYRVREMIWPDEQPDSWLFGSDEDD